MVNDSGGASIRPPISIVPILHLVVSLGILLAMDMFLKQAFAAAAINFPSALFAMFSVLSVLIILDLLIPPAATSLMNFFEPAVMFIQRWLPLFYVPSLVVLPLAVKDIPTASGIKICFIIAGGWLASLAVAGYAAIAVRKLVKTEMVAAEPMGKPSPFSGFEVWTWTGVFVVSFATALIYPTAIGTSARTCLPFLLAATVLETLLKTCQCVLMALKMFRKNQGGASTSLIMCTALNEYELITRCSTPSSFAAFIPSSIPRSSSFHDTDIAILICRLPSNVKKVLHPIISCTLSADLAAFAYGYFSQSGMDSVLACQETWSRDILFCDYFNIILIVLNCFIWASCWARTSFDGIHFAQMHNTGIGPEHWTNPSLTAAVVVLTGLVGANFVQTMLDKLRLQDPIARGIATASSAHGFGTAALSAKEPEALPFCAIAYALTGICGTLLCSIAAGRQSLLFVVGYRNDVEKHIL
ncbi:hypothetical protein IFM89_036330 [Coptis chinensis]|uniref:LrgB-like protein n=1 Tax=Coptis chinensis TaxID=261450 RepID=A0A835M886_9MAGN|nr:hypothetical protein IFM89_036330 [Coptis chinensis]